MVAYYLAEPLRVSGVPPLTTNAGLSSATTYLPTKPCFNFATRSAKSPLNPSGVTDCNVLQRTQTLQPVTAIALTL
jgi:hypothetical protein